MLTFDFNSAAQELCSAAVRDAQAACKHEMEEFMENERRVSAEMINEQVGSISVIDVLPVLKGCDCRIEL